VEHINQDIKGDSFLGFFAKEEYVARMERARRMMVKKDLDVLLVCSAENITYFSAAMGFDLTYVVDQRSPLPQFVIIPRDGEPATVLHNLYRETEKQVRSIEDVRFYIEVGAEEKPKYIDIIKDVFQEHKLIGRKVGVELGYEQMMGIPFNDYLRIVNSLRPTMFVDASAILNQLRMVKSEAEINCLRRASEIQSKAFKVCFNTIQEGTTEKDIVRIIRTTVAKEGGLPRWALISSGAPGSGQFGIGERYATDRKLTKGDLLFIDIGATWQGYHSDFSRMGTFGPPSKDVINAHGTVCQALRSVIEAIEPSVKVAELVHVCRAEFKKRGVDISKGVGITSPSRIGHGIGLLMSEMPGVASYDDTILTPGISLAIEPTLQLDDVFFNVEHNVVVTDQGCEILSRFPLDLQEV